MRSFRQENGFTLVELIVAIVVVGILSAFAIKPLKGFVNNIKLRNAASNTEFLLLNARSRAVSNPMVHCGVAFRVHSASTADSVFAFLDMNGDNTYTKGIDSLYFSPIVFKAKDSLNIISASASTIVFRGDGSANTSVGVKVQLYNFIDSISVLASTGRVKVIVK